LKENNTNSKKQSYDFLFRFVKKVFNENCKVFLSFHFMKQSWRFLDDKNVVEKDTVGSTTSLNLYSRIIAENHVICNLAVKICIFLTL